VSLPRWTGRHSPVLLRRAEDGEVVRYEDAAARIAELEEALRGCEKLIGDLFTQGIGDLSLLTARSSHLRAVLEKGKPT